MLFLLNFQMEIKKKRKHQLRDYECVTNSDAWELMNPLESFLTKS